MHYTRVYAIFFYLFFLFSFFPLPQMKNAATWTAYLRTWGGETGKGSNEERPEAITEASAAAAAAVDDFACDFADGYAEEQSG